VVDVGIAVGPDRRGEVRDCAEDSDVPVPSTEPQRLEVYGGVLPRVAVVEEGEEGRLTMSFLLRRAIGPKQHTPTSSRRRWIGSRCRHSDHRRNHRRRRYRRSPRQDRHLVQRMQRFLKVPSYLCIVVPLYHRTSLSVRSSRRGRGGERSGGF